MAHVGHRRGISGWTDKQTDSGNSDNGNSSKSSNSNCINSSNGNNSKSNNKTNSSLNKCITVTRGRIP